MLAGFSSELRNTLQVNVKTVNFKYGEPTRIQIWLSYGLGFADNGF